MARTQCGTSTGVALSIGLLAATAGCQSRAAAIEPPVSVRLTDNFNISPSIAEEYGRVLPTVRVTVVEGNIETIRRQEADVGFALADWAYLATDTGVGRHVDHASDDVRAIAVLQVIPLQLVVSARSGIRDVTGLRGRRVRIGMPRGGGVLPYAGSSELAETVMKAFGITLKDLHVETGSTVEAVARVEAGSLDGLFTVPFLPLPAIGEALKRGSRLLAIEGPVVTRLREEYPFLRPATIPAGTYPGQTEMVRTVGVDGLLVCRRDLDEGLVYDLTRHFFTVVRRLAASQPSLRTLDLGRAAAAPIPLHPGAARYYREAELFP